MSLFYFIIKRLRGYLQYPPRVGTVSTTSDVSAAFAVVLLFIIGLYFRFKDIQNSISPHFVAQQTLLTLTPGL